MTTPPTPPLSLENPTNPENSRAALCDYQAKLRECTVNSAFDQAFVLTEKLLAWLRSSVGSIPATTQLDRLLEAVCTSASEICTPMSSEAITQGEDCCLLVLSILLDLGAGQLLGGLVRRGIVDCQLPIGRQHLCASFESMGVPDAERLGAAFYGLQWRFCPARFDFQGSYDWPEEMVIPICRKEKINNKGGTAQLWQIEIPEEFVSSRLRDAIPSARLYDLNHNVGWVRRSISRTWYSLRRSFCF
jgi:hypothetical protein